ncbi:DUF3099 domain-containing protein [Arthrobacter deserti]|uniref:DUF3099 domain-containing protein n=1 Tax=Arthrobacter deserti TaxID=1742687 RepID=A0ABX1JJA2_9MICC|nr:DUF3099 domain-containing protein [Arthrobacter deserti]
MSARSDNNGEVLNITDAQESHTDEMHRRMVKYTVAMTIRMACLLLFFFIPGWERWLFVAGAVFLPWIAVVIANGGSDNSRLKPSDALLDQAPMSELPSAEFLPRQGRTDVLAGEVVEDDDAAPAEAWQDAPPGSTEGEDGRSAA